MAPSPILTVKAPIVGFRVSEGIAARPSGSTCMHRAAKIADNSSEFTVEGHMEVGECCRFMESSS